MDPHLSLNYPKQMAKILYVEDEPFLAKIVGETLQKQGYEIVLKENGKDAIDAFRIDSFDLCVLDIMLPKMNGFELAEKIREINKIIPIIFLSAKDQTEDVVKGFDVGANDYMRKPFSMEELMVRINHLLQKNSAYTLSKWSNPIFELGIFTFNPKRFELVSPKSAQKLSHKECTILELLCKNLNEVTDRKDILLKAWGDDSFYNSRNLDVYITKLRKFFAEDSNIQIVTLKGVGYQFLVEN